MRTHCHAGSARSAQLLIAVWWLARKRVAVGPFVRQRVTGWRGLNLRRALRLTCALVGLAAQAPAPAVAADCDPATSTGGCTPQDVRPEPGPNGGLRVNWVIFDSPLPNGVTLNRTVQGSPACNQPLSGVTAIDVPAETSFYDDTHAVPGTLYAYSVCAKWDNNQTFCAPNACAGTPAGPPPAPQPTHPGGLAVHEALSWVTPTHAERRWIWTWTAGNGRDYAFVSRETLEANGAWSAVGSNLPPMAARFEEVVGLRATARQTFRVSAARFHPGGGPFDLVSSSNAVTLVPAPLPLPRTPLHPSAAAFSPTRIEIQFAAGDDNVTAWFQVERLNGPGAHWIPIGARVNAGVPGLVIDNGANAQPGFNHPFTYRVCAGNEAGQSCTPDFKAKVASVEQVQTFRLVGLAGKCLDAFGGRTENGTPAILFECTGGANQSWYRPRTAQHPIIGTPSGRCLDVAGANPASGTPVGLWDCNGGPNQSWRVEADGSIRGLAGKCLDVAGGSVANETRIILWDCTGAPNQRWSLQNDPP